MFDGNIVTAAGVSAGIDMALQLTERIAGLAYAQVTQLDMEYDPQPPFQAGSPRTAPPEVTAHLTGVYDAMLTRYVTVTATASWLEAPGGVSQQLGTQEGSARSTRPSAVAFVNRYVRSRFSAVLFGE